MTEQTADTGQTEIVNVNQEKADAFYKVEKTEETDNNIDKTEEVAKDEDTSTSDSTEDSKEALSEKPQEEGEEVAKEDPEKPEEEKKDVEYKLSLEEESYLNDAHLEELKSLAKDNALSNEEAQKMVDFHEKTLAEIIDSAEAAEDKVIEDWAEEVRNDPILGGENLARTSENAKRAVEQFGSPELIEILNETGYGNNRFVVQLLSNIGEFMSDDVLELAGKELHKPKTTEDLFYNS